MSLDKRRSPKLPTAEGRMSLAMLTDLYELTMAYGYWKSGLSELEACFHLSYRSNPFQGGFAIAAGIGPMVETLENFRFTREDTAYLSTLTGNDGRPLFANEFLGDLERLELRCDVDAVPEGTVVFAQEPLVRVRGPIIHAQLLETALLNPVNFQTLIATKAARMTLAAKGDPILEFGLRRAQGGGMAASRAAYIGGCVGTSNVMAGQRYGIPVAGTHAHSWVMAFENESDAFDAWAEAMPNNCTFLVDTYDSIAGVRRAVEVARRLREQGHRIKGIRIDSGDLAYLSIEARRILDDAGFPEAAIVASNELDEHLIASLKEQGARIDIWGVGTRLVTAYDDPALGGVYKLSAIRRRGEPWEPRIKLSEQAMKISTPGVLQVRRYRHDGQIAGDMVFEESMPPGDACTMIDPADLTRRKTFAPGTNHEDLLVPLFRGGRRVAPLPVLEESRGRAKEQLGMLHPGIRRFVNPHVYPVGLEERLYHRRTELILEARGVASHDSGDPV